METPVKVGVSNQTLPNIAGDHLNQNLHHAQGQHLTKNPPPTNASAGDSHRMLMRHCASVPVIGGKEYGALHS
ncbi:hypothetical protein HMPREF0185_01974 [Brevundimonas diminuta 470-4]|nr:hypothetical protein HMPREF0185_01974 [Brevundimonas diminuta 470-4]